MNAYLRPTLVLLLLFTLITGVAYPLAITGVAQIALRSPANGSLAEKDGKVIGSLLIGQNFADARYFHGRPSTTTTADPADASKTIDAPYNAAASTGSNAGPTSKSLAEAVAARAAALGGGLQPADLVTASGSGLDPHISPEGANVQIARVAKARNLPEADIRALVQRQTEGRDWGVLGQPRVNVLALNIALDNLKR